MSTRHPLIHIYPIPYQLVHKPERIVIYDTYHPFRTDLMTAIYSTGFAFVPLPVILMMYPGTTRKVNTGNRSASTMNFINRHKNHANAKIAQVQAEKDALLDNNKALKESMKKMKYSQGELETMEQALVTLSEQRQNELKEVLIPSEDMRVGRLLGKGGFGEVNLATYKGQEVALKQLLHVKPDSVKRFRCVGGEANQDAERALCKRKAHTYADVTLAKAHGTMRTHLPPPFPLFTHVHALCSHMCAAPDSSASS